MDNLIAAAFITGITSGGLSCLAVQGGLVTSSIAQKIEEEYKKRPKLNRKLPMPAKLPVAQPIIFFLAAKLVMHTLLGFLLGGIGSVLTLTPLVRGILQIAIGLFMLGNALRMFNIHPFFRYFSLEPPKVVTRYIRKISKNGSSNALTSIFLGALTILIPCGITQAMMATAVGTGSPALGAMVMFAYILGTGPVFFGVTFLAAKLGSLWEKQLLRFAAVVILIMGLVAVDSGLNLTGSPVSFSRVYASLTDNMAQDQLPLKPTLAVYNPDVPSLFQGDDNSVVPADDPHIVQINVKNNGYQPAKVYARAGLDITLKLVTSNVYSCSRAFVIPVLNLEKVLPATGVEEINIPAQKAGSTLQFSCSMGMYTGTIFFQ
jgi:sulfite exporter TauE/SafE